MTGSHRLVRSAVWGLCALGAALVLAACESAPTVEQLVVNLHHHAESITRIVGTGEQYGLRVRYTPDADFVSYTISAMLSTR